MAEENKTKAHDDLLEATSGLIKEALEQAKNDQHPWYKRVSSYVGGVVLVVVYMVADKYGSEFIDKIVEIVKALCN